MTAAMWAATRRAAAGAEWAASRERLARRDEARRLSAAADQVVAEAVRIVRASTQG